MTLTLNDAKKLLYTFKPTAYFMSANKGGLHYQAVIEDSDVHFTFIVPFNDIGDARFEKTMEAQMLIRYISTFYTDSL